MMIAGCNEDLILIRCRCTSSLKDTFQDAKLGGLWLKMRLFLSFQIVQAPIIKTSMKKGCPKGILAI
jgi:hypothetical protein